MYCGCHHGLVPFLRSVVIPSNPDLSLQCREWSIEVFGTKFLRGNCSIQQHKSRSKPPHHSQSPCLVPWQVRSLSRAEHMACLCPCLQHNPCKIGVPKHCVFPRSLLLFLNFPVVECCMLTKYIKHWLYHEPMACKPHQWQKQQLNSQLLNNYKI